MYGPLTGKKKKLKETISEETQIPDILLMYNNCELTVLLISSVQSLSRVRLFAALWAAARKASLSITNYQSPLKLMSIEWVMPSNHLILCCPLLFPLQSFPASGSFLMSCSSHEVAKVLELQL